jgi:hypothetical protein
MYPRRAIALAVALCALMATARASAWQEAHQTGGDVEVHVDPAGVASIRDVLRWRVVRGPLHWIDLANVDASAVVEPAVSVAGEDGHTLSAHASRREGNVIRVEVDDAHAFMRGTFAFDVRWSVDGLKSGLIVRDGAAWRLAWSSPLATDGFEMAKTTFDLPAAREAPLAVFADTGAVDTGALSTLHREPASDVLELVRPHVARGESVTWALRLDPNALAAVVDPAVRPVAAIRPPAEPDRVREVSSALALLALAISFSALVAHKARGVAAACAARGVRSRSLAPLPDGLRAMAAGVLLAAGVGLQASDSLTPGTALVAAAILVAALRPPVARQAARGPGRWLALRPDEAFETAPGGAHPVDVLDASTRKGRLAALTAGLLVAGLAVAARRIDSHVPWLIALDAAVLVPLFGTGRSCDLPPDGACASSSWLATLFADLRAIGSLRVAPWARILAGGATADELRLLVLPRVVMPGVVGVEIGRAWSTTPAGWAATPEVLVRVLDGSSAAAKLALVLPGARALPGRRTDERVVRLTPRASTRTSLVALTRRLVEALTDRRAPSPAVDWAGPVERRVARAQPAPRGGPRRASALQAAPQRSPSVAASKAC